MIGLKNVIKHVSFYLIIFFVLIFLHECGHCLAAIFTGGECLGIWFLDCENVLALAYTKVIMFNMFQYRITVMFGTITACIVAASLMYLARIKNYSNLYLASSTFLFGDILANWGLSALLQYGDGHMLIEGTTINNILFAVPFIIISIYILVKTQKKFIRM